MGGLSDRFGRRRPTLTCIALFGLTGALCATAPTIQFLLVARFLRGFFGAGSVVCARASVRDVAQGAAAAGLYSQLAMVTMIAPVVAPLLGGQVLLFTSWRGLFWVFTGLCVALFLLAARMMKETLPPKKRYVGKGQVSLARDDALPGNFPFRMLVQSSSRTAVWLPPQSARPAKSRAME